MRRHVRIPSLFAALTAFACGGEGGGADPGPENTGGTEADAGAGGREDRGVPGGGGSPGDAGSPDAAADADAASQTDALSAQDAVTPEPDMALAPVQAVAEWAPFEVPSWRMTTVGSDDPVLEYVETGSFDLPEAGRDFRGLTWTDVTPDENGGLGGFPPAIVYAAARLTVETATCLVLRADNGIAAYVDGVPQPADIYGSGRMRVPLCLKAGGNVVAVRLIGGRGTPALQVWQTPDAVALNLSDLTTPDLPAGATHPQFVGVPLLNLSGQVLSDVVAEVAEDDIFEPTTQTLPFLPPGSMTKLAFALRLKAPPGDAGSMRTVRLRVRARELEARYEQTLDLPVVDPNATHKMTYQSSVDASAQYFGLVPPSDFDPTKQYGVVLTLHGAGVEGIGQAQAYSAKDWTWIAAATNRRPFGFDWEEWGRVDALEVLDTVQSTFQTDPTRVYVTGHSMGGHGTWNVGVHNPGRFATLGPSAGWSSFYTYTGDPKPGGPFGRARASSDTNEYVSNLARRGTYIIHGSADDNVPVREGRDMYARVQEVTEDVQYHEQPGAGHWWDGEAAPGADCVDWPPLFEFMQAHTLDPGELEFDFVTPSPFITPRHSFVELRSALSADADCEVHAHPDGDAVVVETVNVRGLVVDGAALAAKGVVEVEVDGERRAVVPEPMPFGPQDGKRPGLHGPLNDVYRRPFCYVYPDDNPAYAAYAAYQLSYWAIIGNGRACALPRSRLNDTLRAEWNLVHLGPSPAELASRPAGFDWDPGEVRLGDRAFRRAALVYVYPDGERLSAVMVAPSRGERMLYGVQPFSSRSGLPDYLVFSGNTAQAAGFFDPTWGTGL